MPDGNRAAYKRRRTELMAIIAAWQRFCDYAGLDPDTTLQAFGLNLDPMLEGKLAGDTGFDEAMVNEIYQGYMRLWLS